MTKIRTNRTLDDFLRKLSLEDKHVAVIGPNNTIKDDPSLLYFANRIASVRGDLTVMDVMPHAEEASHGNIFLHLRDLMCAQIRGVNVRQPDVIIGDVTKTNMQNEFDIIYDPGTFKSIFYTMAEHKRRDGSNHYLPPISRSFRAINRALSGSIPAGVITDTYNNMLRLGGSAIFVYPDGVQDVYKYLEISMDLHPGMKYELMDGFYREKYIIRDFDRKRLREFGSKEKMFGSEYTKMIISQSGEIELGSNYPHMKVLVATKVSNEKSPIQKFLSSEKVGRL